MSFPSTESRKAASRCCEERVKNLGTSGDVNFSRQTHVMGKKQRAAHNVRRRAAFTRVTCRSVGAATKPSREKRRVTSESRTKN